MCDEQEKPNRSGPYRFGVVSLLPDMFNAITEFGVVGRGFRQQHLSVAFENPRDHTHDKHRTVDSAPYGGGAGMLLQAPPIVAAIRALKARFESSGEAGEQSLPVIYLSPAGKPLTQRGVEHLAALPGCILLAGRYEGVDQRAIELEVDQEISIGDYIVSGGELPAMVLMDAIARLVPGVLGKISSTEHESFSNKVQEQGHQIGEKRQPQQQLECAHYTRPPLFEQLPVPLTLLSGNHMAIEDWRAKNAFLRTWKNRPDLIDKPLSSQQQQWLNEC